MLSDHHQNRIILFVRGYGELSSAAISRAKLACDRYYGAEARLRIVDLFREPALADEYGIIATPTLLQVDRNATRRRIGKFSERQLFDWLAGNADAHI